METYGYIASIFMRLSLGMIGGGGSILTVPILVYLFTINPVLATAYSLFIVGLTALVGGASYLKKGEVDLKTGLIFAVPSFIGVYIPAEPLPQKRERNRNPDKRDVINEEMQVSKVHKDLLCKL